VNNLVNNIFYKTLALALFFGVCNMQAQDTTKRAYMELNYNKQTEYTIADIDVSGNRFINKNIIIFNSGLSFNQKIKVPGNELSLAIENLWKQNLFSNIAILASKIEENKIYLVIEVKENPMLAKFTFRGIGTAEAKNLRPELSIKAGMSVNNDMLNKLTREIKDYYFKKGFYNIKIDLKQEADTVPNKVVLRVFVNKGSKVRIYDIEIVGNDKISDAVLRSTMAKTLRKKNKWKLWKSSKYIESQFQEDKEYIIKKYNSEGHRDARILFDSVVLISPNRVAIKIGVLEGAKYHFRDITFTGNNKYASSDLAKILGINRGDIYDNSLLDERLKYSQNGTDISSLYMDDGYLFFGVEPIETRVENDSIDIEIRIVERSQATYNNIIIKGNTKTSDHVVLREIRTRPGQKFSRSDITRSIRELTSLGFFDPQAFDVTPVPNAQNGTVDIVYTVAEKPNDQIELSGGWGGNPNNRNFQQPGVANTGFGGLVGTLGLTLNNFSTKKLFTPSLWSPLPAGDGQKLSLRAQSNGAFFQSYSFSLTEPWFGGKKPNSFSTSLYRTNQRISLNPKSSPLGAYMDITGVSVSLGKRLKWPDDNFSVFYSLSLQQYDYKNAGLNFGLENASGKSNNLEFKTLLSRSTVFEPIFPTSGSTYTFSIAVTPPIISLGNKDLSILSPAEKTRWIEYHKWKFDAENYTKIVGKLVSVTKFRFGYLGLYNSQIGYSPFERFVVGGSGLNSFGRIGTEIVSQRGYSDRSISENATNGVGSGAVIYNKFTYELRYSFTNTPAASIYALAFLEAGNAFANSKDYNPFNMKRSAGVGVRLFLPMFGLLGFDYGYGFDRQTMGSFSQENKWLPHFFIGQQF